MTENGIRVLQEFGFSNYEARAYLTLLGNSPLTGYQLAKLCGVPRSRIYETLEKLTQKGLVFTLQSDPVRHAPLNSRELLTRLRSGFDDSLKILEDEVAHAPSRSAMESIWTIQGRANILAKAQDMIVGASESVYLAAWDQVIREIKPALEQAGARGVRIIVVSCGDVDLSTGILYRHRFQEQLSATGGSSIDLVVDGTEVLVGEATQGEMGQAAWTRNIGLVFIAQEYIRHEVYIHKLIEKLGTGSLDEVRSAFVEGLAEIPHRDLAGDGPQAGSCRRTGGG